MHQSSGCFVDGTSLPFIIYDTFISSYCTCAGLADVHVQGTALHHYHLNTAKKETCDDPLIAQGARNSLLLPSPKGMKRTADFD